MEEHLPYKQEVGGSIPPCPNDIIVEIEPSDRLILLTTINN